MSHSAFFRKTTIGIPWEQLQIIMRCRFYAVQVINLKTNVRVYRVMSDSSLKKFLPQHWERLQSYSERGAYFEVACSPLAIAVEPLEYAQ